MLLAQGIGRWGNWFNNELYGKETDLPWALKIDPDNATAYAEVASQLGAMRQYPRAAEKYLVAIKRAWDPDNMAPLIGFLASDAAEKVTALSAVALQASVQAFDPRVHVGRPDASQQGVALILHTMQLLKAMSFGDYGLVTVLINGDEEVSSPGSRSTSSG